MARECSLTGKEVRCVQLCNNSPEGSNSELHSAIPNYMFYLCSSLGRKTEGEGVLGDADNKLPKF